MYSNLRVAGGSNHLLLPTNLLRLTGAVVRVEACSSAAVNALYPGDSFLSALSPRQERALSLAISRFMPHASRRAPA